MSIEEIKLLISSTTDKEALKKSADPTLVKEIEEVNNWKKSVDKVDIVVPAHSQQQNRNQKKEYQKGGKTEGGEKG